MMVGSFLINCWTALFAFTIYFLITFQNGVPSKVIIGSFIASAIAFVIAYPFRLLLGYIIYTPEDMELEEIENNEEMSVNKDSVDSTSNFSDESPEDIAKVVRNMINQDDSFSTN